MASGAAAFEWDEYHLEHVTHHGLSADQAEEAATDPRRWQHYAGMINGEPRTEIVGRTLDGDYLFVVTTPRRGRTRFVMARRAEPQEKRRYRRWRK